VTPKEQEIAIGELEERVDRLRNIYEQYFLGFEKLEPTVPRKDVDRRFAILRKEQIRNTALRFRFQVVTQKFNTYAMHWVRICRQIEDGTYKRHVRKAKARFGDGARSAYDGDVSIDIDMDDFADGDMDSVLAEAEASAASYQNESSDTVPPPAAPQERARDRAPQRPQMVLTTPGTSFAVTGRRESLDDLEPNTPMPASVRSTFGAEPRTGRGAALPEGAKPRLLRKREGSEPPASNPRLPAGSRPDLDIPGGRPAGPRIQRAAAPAPGAPAPAAAAAPGPAAAPAPAPAPAAAPSAGRMSAAMPIGRVAVPGGPIAPGAASAGRIPAAGAPSAGRLPVPSAPSAGRMAAAPPSQPDAPAQRPAPSAGRFPASPAMRPPPGIPGGGGAQSAGGMKAAPPPPSIPKLPPTTLPRPNMGPGARPPGAAGGAPARPPAPSQADSEPSPPSAESRPSVRPRAPLPLPSQLNRGGGPTKKE